MLGGLVYLRYVHWVEGQIHVVTLVKDLSSDAASHVGPVDP